MSNKATTGAQWHLNFITVSSGTQPSDDIQKTLV
jgi:hypothetical protein